MRIKNRVAIVTGGGQGIGKAIAEKLGKEGAKILLAEIDEQTGKEAAEYLRLKNIESTFVQTDVSNEKSVKKMIEIAVDTYGYIDILINNAAISIRKSVLEVTLEEWERVLKINLTGPFLCSKYALPEMINRKRGTIINIGSWHAEKTITRFASYPASKGGLLALTRQMSLDYGKYQVRTNAVCPSIVDSEMSRKTFKDLPDSDEAYKQTVNFQPMGRIGTGEDIANACLFLASDESSYVNGQSLIIDGGSINKIARPLLFD